MESLVYYGGNILVYNNNIIKIFNNICSKNKLYGINTGITISKNPFILSKF